MQILVISDVHGNLDALEAVLRHAGEVDGLWFLGDAVGYGPDPSACVDRLARLRPQHWLAGNHDWAALGKLDTDDFNEDARLAVEWTARKLSDAAKTRLTFVQPSAEAENGAYALAHGSPRHPVWEYILDAGTAADNFEHFSAAVCLFGHTHVPVVYEQAVDGVLRRQLVAGEPLEPGASRYLINPGSVGQPRDGDSRASYMLLDLDSGCFTLHRVEYDVSAVQGKILDAGLPARLAVRLDYGW